MVRSLIVWLRFEWKRGLAVLHATNMLNRLAVRGATTKTDLLVVLDVLTINRMCHLYAAHTHAEPYTELPSRELSCDHVFGTCKIAAMQSLSRLDIP